MQNELLVALHGSLELADGDVLAGPVRDEDRARSVKISSVVTRKVWDVCSIVDHDVLESCE